MRTRSIMAFCWLALAATTVAAQSFMRTLPEDTRRAQLSHVAENVVTLDGRQVMLAPGAQIRGANNLIVLPTALPRVSLVKYQLDDGGSLMRAWILTPEEAAQPDKYATPIWPWSTSPEVGRSINQILPQTTPAPASGVRN